MRKLFSVALIAAAGMMSSAAQADVHWYVSGTFSDGATLSGTFDINQYGFLANPNLTTTGTPGFMGMTYVTSSISGGNTATQISLYYNNYADGLILNFADDIKVGEANNALLVSSVECRDNYCASNGNGALRFLTSGFASINPISNVPEPASWALMIAGFGVTGVAMRRAKVRAVRYAA